MRAFACSECPDSQSSPRTACSKRSLPNPRASILPEISSINPPRSNTAVELDTSASRPGLGEPPRRCFCPQRPTPGSSNNPEHPSSLFTADPATQLTYRFLVRPVPYRVGEAELEVDQAQRITSGARYVVGSFRRGTEEVKMVGSQEREKGR